MRFLTGFAFLQGLAFFIMPATTFADDAHSWCTPGAAKVRGASPDNNTNLVVEYVVPSKTSTDVVVIDGPSSASIKEPCGHAHGWATCALASPGRRDGSRAPDSGIREISVWLL